MVFASVSAVLYSIEPQDELPMYFKAAADTSKGQFYAQATAPVHVIVPLKARIKQTGREFKTTMDFQQATDSREEKRVLRAQDDAQRQAALRQQLIDAGDWDGGTLWLQRIEDSEVEYFYDSTKPFKIRELEVLQTGAENIRDLPVQAAAPQWPQVCQGPVMGIKSLP